MRDEYSRKLAPRHGHCLWQAGAIEVLLVLSLFSLVAVSPCLAQATDSADNAKLLEATAANAIAMPAAAIVGQPLVADSAGA